MSNDRQKIVQAAIPGIMLVIILWLVKLFELASGMQLHAFGIHPRTLDGTPGILTHVFIHGDMAHLVANSLPLLILSWMARYFYPSIFNTVFYGGWVLTGLMVWIMARPTWHIGASTLVYVLAFFVFLSSALRKNPRHSAIAFFTIFMYGGMIWGVLPLQPGVSWEGHLCGAVTGLAVAIAYRNLDVPPPPFSDEETENPFKYEFRPENHADDA